MKAQIIQALRWIAVLPGAIIGFVLAQLAVIVMLMPDFLAQLWSAWVCPIAFILAGVYIAPKFKFVVALILTALMSITIFLVLLSGHVPCVADCVWPAVPQPAKWQRIGNQIDAAFIFARATS